MTEKVHHFSVSATDELNNDRGVQRLPPKHFVLLMIGLVALLLLLYVQIIWVKTAAESFAAAPIAKRPTNAQTCTKIFI
jgi:hypothetical protein